MNRVTLLGNVGKDPEIFKTNQGVTIAKFSLATSKKINGEELTEWHNLKLFNKTAEVAEKYVSKGSKILVEGSIEYNSWETEGKKYYKTEINVKHLELVSYNPSNKENNNDKNVILKDKVSSISLEEIEDGLPF